MIGLAENIDRVGVTILETIANKGKYCEWERNVIDLVANENLTLGEAIEKLGLPAAYKKKDDTDARKI
jgi:hypothetical protein